MIDQAVFRSVMAAYPTGVTIVTAGAGDLLCGMAANSFTSVSLDPPLVLVCSQHGARTAEAAKLSGRFAIHLLGSDQVEAVRSFVGRDAPRFSATAHTLDEHGTPILDQWIGLLVCRLDRIVDAGDHEILIGEVERCERQVHPPLLFHDSRFHELPALPAIRMTPPLLADDELLDLSDPFVRVLMPGR
jgi:3-hydroxy-9,10-secoandrosta-1,3,5(10)-triene-9,17-dione monooxygenase reductase component